MPYYTFSGRPTRWPLTNPHIQQLFQVPRIRKSGLKSTRREFGDSSGLIYDVDFFCHKEKKSESLAIIVHGLAANTSVAHVQGMIRKLYNAGLDVAGMNLPGSSRQEYPTKERYHFGYTQPLDHFVQWCEARGSWKSVYLLGFSLGGSIVINYLSQKKVSGIIRKGMAISVPLDINEFYRRINEKGNKIYEKSFILALGIKEALSSPGEEVLPRLWNIKTLEEFDATFILPETPYTTMEDYIRETSGLNKLKKVNRPLLLLNAKDDTFLTSSSYPKDENIQNRNLYLAYPEHGAHCGFRCSLFSDYHYSEDMAESFFK